MTGQEWMDGSESVILEAERERAGERMSGWVGSEAGREGWVVTAPLL